MKKKLLVLAMTGMMAASMLTACGGKETAATTAAETTVAAETTAAEETTEAAEEETAAEAEEAAEGTGSKEIMAKYDEYLGWTSTEWAAANDDEKLNAAIVFSVYTTETLGGQAFDDTTRALVIDEMKAAEDIKNVVDQLDMELPTVKMSIKEFADTGVEQINAMIEAGAEEATE